MLNKIYTLFFLFAISFSVIAEPSVKVIGLFSDKALLLIDGTRKMLRTGESYEDLVLESANANEAVISYRGVSKKYTMGHSSGSISFVKPKRASFTITADSRGMYYTQGSVNGHPMDFIVDTGATMVSLNKHHAQMLGINPEKDGKEINVLTASQKVKGYKVRLKSVNLGSIRLRDVDATIIMGDQPAVVLLGMSFLKHLKITNSGNMMRLEKL